MLVNDQELKTILTAKIREWDRENDMERQDIETLKKRL